MLIKRKCRICKTLKPITMELYGRKFLICLKCYSELDRRNPKDFGNPKIYRNMGTHTKNDTSL